MPLKWGILSAGKISHDFVNAMGTLDTNDHQVVAVAARDLNRAKDFAKRFAIPTTQHLKNFTFNIGTWKACFVRETIVHERKASTNIVLIRERKETIFNGSGLVALLPGNKVHSRANRKWKAWHNSISGS